MNYEEKDEFADVVKRAKLRIENVYELDLRKKGGAGAIFALKNFDWHDRQEIEQKQKTEVSFASEKAQKIADEYEEKLRDEL